MSAAFGDKAGEHTKMSRGRHSSWLYVGCGAALHFFLTTFIVAGLLHLALGWITAFDVGTVLTLLSVVIGAGVVWFTYLDRWKVNEAYTSRHSTGPLDASIFYAPIISWGYALARMWRRLQGK